MRLLLLILALAVAASAAAQDFPALTGRVVDAAELLSPDEERRLTGRLEALEQATSRQLVIVTVPSLEGYSIEDYGYRLGRHWEIGQSEANNGALLIVAPTERRVRIEVGYGLEGIMTDALASAIVNNDILPRFRANDYPGGIIAGADAIIAQFQAPPEEAEARIAAAGARQAAAASARRDRGDGSIIPFMIWGGILLVIVLTIAGRAAGGRNYRSGNSLGWIVLWEVLEELSRNHPSSGGSSWSSGGSSWGGSSWGSGGGGWSGGGGGGFSGGGGSFGGGGASGGW